MLSYAQAREDVILSRALNHVHHAEAFYIDVGAYHPTLDSVTKHFYDHGWHGVNVEPSRELFPQFVIDRPRDINLQAAVTDKPGSVTFHTVEGQLGTLEDGVAQEHVAQGWTSQSYTVEAMTLDMICEAHAPRDIHFLKIDVEGHEAAALRGLDLSRFRPWVLVVEATKPNRLDLLTHHEWEGLLMVAGYRFMLADLPNRYYVAMEHPELMRHFSVPVDVYALAGQQRRIAQLEAELALARERLAETGAASKQG